MELTPDHHGAQSRQGSHSQLLPAPAWADGESWPLDTLVPRTLALLSVGDIAAP